MEGGVQALSLGLLAVAGPDPGEIVVPTSGTQAVCVGGIGGGDGGETSGSLGPSPSVSGLSFAPV